MKTWQLIVGIVVGLIIVGIIGLAVLVWIAGEISEELAGNELDTEIKDIHEDWGYSITYTLTNQYESSASSIYIYIRGYNETWKKVIDTTDYFLGTLSEHETITRTTVTEESVPVSNWEINATDLPGETGKVFETEITKAEKVVESYKITYEVHNPYSFIVDTITGSIKGYNKTNVMVVKEDIIFDLPDELVGDESCVCSSTIEPNGYIVENWSIKVTGYKA